MKNATCVALMLGIVFILSTVFAEEEPPATQTPEKEAQTNEKTDKESPKTLIKRVVISEDGTITIYYYGIDDTEILTPQIVPETNRNEADNTTPYSGDQIKAREIMDKFSSVWGKNMGGFPEHVKEFVKAGLLNEKFAPEEYLSVLKELPNTLTPEELKTADSLAKEYINLYSEHPTRIMEDYYLGWLASKGNRYVTDLDEALNAANRLPTIGFYIDYIRVSPNEARIEDIPTDEDKRWAIRKLTSRITQTDVVDFDKGFWEEIYRLDPEAHSLLSKVLNERKNQ